MGSNTNFDLHPAHERPRQLLKKGNTIHMKRNFLLRMTVNVTLVVELRLIASRRWVAHLMMRW